MPPKKAKNGKGKKKNSCETMPKNDDGEPVLERKVKSVPYWSWHTSKSKLFEKERKNLFKNPSESREKDGKDEKEEEEEDFEDKQVKSSHVFKCAHNNAHHKSQASLTIKLNSKNLYTP